MADQAVILRDKRVVKLIDISNLEYTLNGFLNGFTLASSGVKYIQCVEADAVKQSLEMFQQKIPKGFYAEELFHDYRKRNDTESLKTLLDSFYDGFFINATPGDIIDVKKINLFFPYAANDFGKWRVYSLTYTGQSLVNSNGEIIEPPIPFIATIQDMGLVPVSQQFYESNISDFDLGVTEVDKYNRALLISNIAVTIHNINTVIFPLFDFPELIGIKDSQNNFWITDIFENPTYADLSKYYVSIYNFYRTCFLNKKRIQEAKGPEKLYYLALGMSSNSLTILSSLNKITLLSWMQQNVRLGQKWIFFNDNEGLTIRIIDSVTAEQSDLFLQQLFEYSDTYNNNLFERLADDSGFLSDNVIDDATFGIGEDNRYKFIMSLYLVWQRSWYNPYQNDVYSDTNLNRFQYTNKQLGTNPDSTDSSFEDIFFQNSNELNFDAKPISLNYKSTSSGGYFIDNFYFRSANIKADLNHAHFDNINTDLSDFTNLKEAPKNKVLAFQKEYRKDGKDGLYGTYDYLQSVSLVEANIDAVIKIPVVNEGSTINNDVNNLIPIFVLKYIDDKNLASNIETTVGYITDIIFIASGGYGAISKVKYLNGLAGFTPTIMEGTEMSTAIKVIMYTSYLGDVLNLTSASISLYLKIITDSNNSNDEGFKALKEFVLWTEIFSGVGSVLAEYKLRKCAKKAVNSFNESNNWPQEFVDDSRGLEAKNSLNKLANSVEDITQLVNKEYEIIYPNLKSRIKSSNGVFQFNHFELEFTEQNLKTLIEEAIELEVYNRKFIEDFVTMSCRNNVDKKFTYSETITMLIYYAKVTLPKGFCTGFHNLTDYKLLCNKFKTFTDDYFMSLNLNIQKYEVQGSVLFKHHPNNPVTSFPVLTRGNPPIMLTPDDFDGRMLISSEDGKKVANYLKDYWNGTKKFLNKKDFNATRWGFIQNTISDTYIDQMLSKGMINKTILPLDYVNGLKSAVKNNGADIFFPLNKKGFSEVGGAFIIKGSNYDILPVMEFKY